MSGYVRIHRTLIGHPVFRNDAEAMVFAWLITQAQWKRTRVRYKDHMLDLERGQLAISLRDLAHRFDRDKAWISRLLKRLQNESMIETASETGVTRITICNYGEYQADPVLCETPSETRRDTGARQVRDTEQEREKGKKKVTPIPPEGGRRGKTVLPSDWQLPPVSDLPPKARACAEKWTRASYETEGEAFTLYWRSCGRMMKDWDATWANRVISRNEAILRAQKFGHAPTDKADKRERTAQEWREQAEWYVRHGMTDNANECRQRAIQLEQKAAA